ncbi:MAG: hypothetical protein WBF88_09655 [Pusillimonas sp.]
MKLSRHIAHAAIAGLMALAVAGNAAAADRKTTNTLLGAGLGAAAGAVLSEGDMMMTLGGAAAGGLLGNVLTEERKQPRWKGHDRSYRSDRRYVDYRKHHGKHHAKKHHRKHRR